MANVLRVAAPSGVRRAVTLAAATGLVGGMAFAGGDGTREGDRLVKAALISEQSALVPGGRGTLGVHLKIEPQWHVYWRNNGDSGVPVGVTFLQVPGLKIGECQWPAPVRHISDGEILDYVHEGEVTLLFPVELESGAKAGGTIDIKAKVDWLVCKDLCLPGGAEVSISLPVAATASAGADAGRFTEARRTHPRAPKAGEVSTQWSGRTLEVRSTGATGLTFFPYESDAGVLPVDMLKAGQVRGASMKLEYTEEVDRASRVRGLLVVERGDQHEYLLVDTGGPGPR